MIRCDPLWRIQLADHNAFNPVSSVNTARLARSLTARATAWGWIRRRIGLPCIRLHGGPPILLIVLTVEVRAADLLEIARAGHSDPAGESKRRLIRIRMSQSS